MNQRNQIMQYMKDFGRISTLDAFRDLGITRLASRIHEIRESGVEVEDEWVHSVNRYHKPVKYKSYYFLELQEDMFHD